MGILRAIDKFEAAKRQKVSAVGSGGAVTPPGGSLTTLLNAWRSHLQQVKNCNFCVFPVFFVVVLLHF